LFAFGLAVIMWWRLLSLDMWNAQAIAVGPWWLPWRIVIGSFAIAAFSAASWWYRVPRHQPVLRPVEAQAFHVYFVGAALLLWQLLSAEVKHHWWTTAWALESTGTVLLGFWLRDRALRVLGAIGAGWVSLSALTLLFLGLKEWWSPWASSVVVTLLFGLSQCYRVEPTGDRFGVEVGFRHGYVLAATTLLTALLWNEVDRQWLSVAWGIEGFVLVASGFVQRDKVLRVAGLVVFGLLVLKILFVDLAGAETIYRILSFIVAGCLLLAASYGYARFSVKGRRIT
jgi:hypothetical protein